MLLPLGSTNNKSKKLIKYQDEKINNSERSGVPCVFSDIKNMPK